MRVHDRPYPAHSTAMSDDDFTPAGDTPERRIAEIRSEIEMSQANIAELTDPAAVSREVVPLNPGVVPAEVTRAQMAQVRGRALKESQRLQALQKRLVKEIEAQMAAAKAEVELMMKPLRKQLAVMEEGLWTVNLYLGRDEEIVPLLDGEPAPADTPITLRQQVLSMDEETAAHADQGGIDARHIEVFDEWIKDPSHLEQVFPEPKGVVVLVPRSRGRDYQDPWVNEAMRQANAQSYFLLRNGGNLFRMATDFQVGRHLIPTTDEFTGLFVVSRFNHETRQTETHEILPGTKEWDDASERQDARQRHYMRMALILQGLVDRTTVFHPLPPQGVNLLHNDAYENGTAVLIRDAEGLLTDGREDFYDWLKRLNAELRVGMRVLGAFATSEFNDAGDYRSGSSSNGWRERPNNRITPRSSSYPRSDVVHRLEGRKALHGVQGFTFKFDRADQVWTRDGRLRAAKNRGTCTILPTDKFLLPYDLVTVEELRYYLGSRRQRHAYEHMFPLLHAAVAAKEAEAAEEAPFRVLLAGELVKADGSLTLDEATALLDELVHWWKLSAKHHRALNGDPAHESRAIREIVAEHLARTGAAQTQSGDAAAEQAMVDRLLAQDPSIMVIARKRDGGYLAFAPQPRTYPAGRVGYPATNVEQPAELTDEEQKGLRDSPFDPPHKKSTLIPAAVADNVWAVEYVASKTGRSIKRREWTMPSTRLDATRILHATSKWEGWDVHADPNTHLTDLEIDAAIAEFLLEVESSAAEGWPSTRRINGEPQHAITPRVLGVTLRMEPGEYESKPAFSVHLIDDAMPDLDAVDHASRRHEKMQYGTVRIPFTKTARGVRLHRMTDDNPYAQVPWTLRWEKSTYSNAPADKPWHYFWDGKANDSVALVTFPENGAFAVAKAAAIKEHNRAVGQLHDEARKPIRIVKRAWEQRAEAQAYARFIEDYADPELWEGHKKTLRGLEADIHPAGRGIPTALDDALRRFTHEGRSLEGHTVHSVIKACGLPLDDVAEDLLDLPVWEPAEEATLPEWDWDDD